MRHRFLRTRLGVVLLLSTACADQRTAVITAPPTVQAASMMAFLSVSSSAVLTGEELTVSGNVRLGTGTPRVGSYLARMAYDPAQLEFIGELPVDAGARAVNPQQGQITVAGASADGITSERLFAMRFKVIGAHPLTALQLEVQELNDVAYGARTSSLQRKSSLYLDALTSP
jgi:hypothetical protein